MDIIGSIYIHIIFYINYTNVLLGIHQAPHLKMVLTSIRFAWAYMYDLKRGLLIIWLGFE